MGRGIHGGMHSGGGDDDELAKIFLVPLIIVLIITIYFLHKLFSL